MEKQTYSAPGPNAEPPPYSAVAPPHSMAPHIQPIPIPIYAPHPHPHHPHHPHHHHQLGHYGPESVQSVVQTHTITQQPGATVHVVTSSQLFGPNPKTMVCSACNQTVSSKVIQQSSMRTHIFALSLCLLGCWPCVPCVYCTDSCKNVNHYCPNCDAYQGSFIPPY